MEGGNGMSYSPFPGSVEEFGDVYSGDKKITGEGAELEGPKGDDFFDGDSPDEEDSNALATPELKEALGFDPDTL